MQIELLPNPPEERHVLDNLGRFYVYDFTDFMDWACPENGLFGCGTDEFWASETNRFFVIRVDGELAGFAVVDASASGPEWDYDIAEFFVLRKFRRRGVGAHVARELFDRFRGRWQVRVLVENTAAHAFWRDVIAGCTDGHCRHGEIADDHYRYFVHWFDSREP
jgi:predicted acetyltransferase